MLIFEIALLLIFLGLDIGSKYLVADMLLSSGGTKVVIPDILTFVYAENTGASFGIFSGKPILLSVVAIVASIGLFVFLLFNRKGHILMRISLIMIISGALGNVYDRLVFGYVRDFIQYTFLKTWFNYSFPVCNVADIFLTIGAVLLIIYVIFIYKEKPKQVSAASGALAMSIADKPAEELVSGNVDFSSGGDEPYPEVKGEKSFSEPKKESDIKVSDKVVFECVAAPVEKPHSDAVVVPETTFEDRTKVKEMTSKPSIYEVQTEVSFENTEQSAQKTSVKRKKSEK